MNGSFTYWYFKNKLTTFSATWHKKRICETPCKQEGLYVGGQAPAFRQISWKGGGLSTVVGLKVTGNVGGGGGGGHMRYIEGRGSTWHITCGTLPLKWIQTCLKTLPSVNPTHAAGKYRTFTVEIILYKTIHRDLTFIRIFFLLSPFSVLDCSSLFVCLFVCLFVD